MCGIVAIITPDRPAPPEAVTRSVARLRHRGPDAAGSARFPGCDLGHARLSVIDLAGGAQPMSDPAGRFWITFNGEIYNYRELRRELESLGRLFRTASDTEVLLVAYQQWGERCVDRLNGQFAFVVWDNANRRAFAARDRFGEKPLYWAQADDGGGIVLASEIKAILASGLVSPRIDPAAVDAFLVLLYVPPDRTIYENIYTLAPGAAMTWDNGRRRSWRYWTPALSTNHSVTGPEAVDEIRRLIERAVERQMVADVPVGAFLSGGLDSSTIVALMTRGAGRPVKTFSVGFGDLIDELPYARAVADAYQTEHHELRMEVPLAETVRRMAEVYDEPLADSSNVPTFLMCQFASRSVKVALAGDGGDELFGGYAWYRPLLQCLADFPRGGADLWDRHVTTATMLGSGRTDLWGGGRAGAEWASAGESLIRALYRPPPTVVGIDRAVDFDLRCYLPGDILVKVDRAAMAHGLETRSPLLDVELVNFVTSLPSRMRFEKDGPLKPLLRGACESLWPPALRGRPKQGFGAPIQKWIVQPAICDLTAQVAAPGSALLNLLPGAGARLQPFLEPRPGTPLPRWRDAQMGWSLLCLGLWLEGHRPA